MKKDGDKLVKILLDSGVAMTAYACLDSIVDLANDSRFVHFSDDGNDMILINKDSIAGFEVLDDRVVTTVEAEKVEAEKLDG
jgi:hypothetical protein